MTDAPTKDEVAAIARAMKTALEEFRGMVVSYSMGERGDPIRARARTCREHFQAASEAYLRAGIDEELWCDNLKKAFETVALYENDAPTTPSP